MSKKHRMVGLAIVGVAAATWYIMGREAATSLLGAAPPETEEPSPLTRSKTSEYPQEWQERLAQIVSHLPEPNEELRQAIGRAAEAQSSEAVHAVGPDSALRSGFVLAMRVGAGRMTVERLTQFEEVNPRGATLDPTERTELDGVLRSYQAAIQEIAQLRGSASKSGMTRLISEGRALVLDMEAQHRMAPIERDGKVYSVFRVRGGVRYAASLEDLPEVSSIAEAQEHVSILCAVHITAWFVAKGYCPSASCARIMEDLAGPLQRFRLKKNGG